MVSDMIFLTNSPFYGVFDTEGEGGNSDGGNADGGTPDGGITEGDKSGKDDKNKQVTFDAKQQDKINKLLAEERRKGKEQTQKALDEAKALEAKARLTSQEREELALRLETLQDELLTKEELARKNQEKQAKEFQLKLDETAQNAEKYKSLYEMTVIDNAITGAAASEKAFSTHQIIAMLKPATRLVEELESDGRPTGRSIPKVKLDDHDKDGKPITLDLTVPEAVKRMKDMDQFVNLFRVEGTGGIGGTTRPGAAKDVKTIARDPKTYREARKSGLIQ